MTLTINVVIPTYNDGSALALCLEAMSRQSLPQTSFDVTVVDNGSDRLPSIPKESNVRLLTEPRIGSYAARNLGITSTRAPLVAFTDADCIPDDDWLAGAATFLSENPEIDAIGGRIVVFSVDADRRTSIEVFQSITGFPQETYVVAQSFAATANMVARREVFDDIGLFSDELKSGGDVEFGNRLVDRGYNLVYVASVVVRHPARRSLSSYLAKQRRTMAGARDLAEMRGQAFRAPLPDTLRALIPPVPSMFRALRSREVGPVIDRIKLASITAVIHYARIYNRLRLQSGAISPR